MTAAQLILVSVTAAIVAVFTMLVVATILRARAKDEPDREAEEQAADNGADGRRTGDSGA